jgi:hypothetical protein
MLPRFLVALAGVMIFMFTLLIFFSKWVDAFWFWAAFVMIFGILFIFLGVEYFRSTQLVKGAIGSVKISDLTKAIYWLSTINSRKGNFSLGGYHYWRNVENVTKTLGGKLHEEWQGIVSKYKLSVSRKIYVLFAIPLLCMPIILVVIIIDFPFSLTAPIMGLILAIVMGVLFLTGSHLRTLKNMATDPEVKRTTNYLLHELISWTSANSNKPIRVIAAGNAYPNTRSAGSLFGFLIIEITPMSGDFLKIEETQPSPIGVPFHRKGIVSLLIYVIPAVLMGYFLVFRSIQRVIEKASFDSIVFAILSISVLVFFELALYWYIPIFRGMLRGDISPSDFALAARRFTKGMLKSYSEDPMFKQRINFILETYRRNRLKTEEISESIRLWIKKDSEQPPQLRYFVLSHDSVELTNKGKELAEILMKKLNSS